MSKDAILKKVKTNKPPVLALPSIPRVNCRFDSLADAFKVNATLSGSQVIEIDHEEQIQYIVDQQFADMQRVYSCHPAFEGWGIDKVVLQPQDLENIDVAIIRSTLGVAENGAIWLDEEDFDFRVLPFLTEHLAIVLHAKDVVDLMHTAYANLQVDRTGFGVFIAGPSKTADIEQSLVVGAQGPRSHSILLIKS